MTPGLRGFERLKHRTVQPFARALPTKRTSIPPPTTYLMSSLSGSSLRLETTGASNSISRERPCRCRRVHDWPAVSNHLWFALDHHYDLRVRGGRLIDGKKGGLLDSRQEYFILQIDGLTVVPGPGTEPDQQRRLISSGLRLGHCDEIVMELVGKEENRGKARNIGMSLRG